jgi:cbb3-type cytochrome oxidase maturation protein
MNILLMLILVSLALAVLALLAFLWATHSGQFDDTSTPSLRVLTDDAPRTNPSANAESKPAETPPSPKSKSL